MPRVGARLALPSGTFRSALNVAVPVGVTDNSPSIEPATVLLSAAPIASVSTLLQAEPAKAKLAIDKKCPATVRPYFAGEVACPILNAFPRRRVLLGHTATLIPSSVALRPSQVRGAWSLAVHGQLTEWCQRCACWTNANVASGSQQIGTRGPIKRPLSFGRSVGLSRLRCV